jgi:hypothetical protein
MLAVRGEGGLVVECGVVGESLERGAVGVNTVYVGGAGTLRSERDPITLARPRRIVVKRPALGQGVLAGAVSIGDVQGGFGGAKVIDEDTVCGNGRKCGCGEGKTGQRCKESSVHGRSNVKMF